MIGLWWAGVMPRNMKCWAEQSIHCPQKTVGSRLLRLSWNRRGLASLGFSRMKRGRFSWFRIRESITWMLSHRLRSPWMREFPSRAPFCTLTPRSQLPLLRFRAHPKRHLKSCWSPRMAWHLSTRQGSTLRKQLLRSSETPQWSCSIMNSISYQRKEIWSVKSPSSSGSMMFHKLKIRSRTSPPSNLGRNPPRNPRNLPCNSLVLAVRVRRAHHLRCLPLAPWWVVKLSGR